MCFILASFDNHASRMVPIQAHCLAKQESAICRFPGGVYDQQAIIGIERIVASSVVDPAVVSKATTKKMRLD